MATKKTKSKSQSTKKESVKKEANTEEQAKGAGEIEASSASGDQEKATVSDIGTRTIGSMIGEIVWLMSQSPAHKHLSLADLEWVLMPPVILGQYKLFRDANKKPVGAALWGYLNESAEERLKAAGKLAPQDWGNNATLDPDKGLVATEGGTLWLVELITPFHTKDNKHREQLLSDLMSTVFKDKSVKMMHISPETNKREEVTIAEKKKEESVVAA